MYCHPKILFGVTFYSVEHNGKSSFYKSTPLICYRFKFSQIKMHYFPDLDTKKRLKTVDIKNSKSKSRIIVEIWLRELRMQELTIYVSGPSYRSYLAILSFNEYQCLILYSSLITIKYPFSPKLTSFDEHLSK